MRPGSGPTLHSGKTELRLPIRPGRNKRESCLLCRRPLSTGVARNGARPTVPANPCVLQITATLSQSFVGEDRALPGSEELRAFRVQVSPRGKSFVQQRPVGQDAPEPHLYCTM